MYFEYDNNKYEVEIIRKNNKNLYIRISDDMKIVITCPRLFTKLYIKKIINDNNSTIIKMIEKQKLKNNRVSTEKYSLLGNKLSVEYDNIKKPIFDGNKLIIKDDIMLNKWYLDISKKIFKEHLDNIYNHFEEKIPYPKIKIRKMKTRWGVCNRRDNSVSLNFDLIKKDERYLDYVIVHELSHFVHFNHSKMFWMEVEKYCPNYKAIRKELKE